MQWRDRSDRYGLVTRVFHWLIAGLILWQLLGMILKNSLGRHPLVSPFVIVHQPIGMAILVLVVLRILWALRSRHQRPAHAKDMMGKFAALGQRLLYLLMLIVPVFGILRANSRGAGPARPGGPAGPGQIAPGTSAPPPAEVDPWIASLASLHGLLAWTLMILIAGHIVMAVYHAFIKRDGATEPMFGRLRG